jgi:hypothetical protein
MGRWKDSDAVVGADVWVALNDKGLPVWDFGNIHGEFVQWCNVKIEDISDDYARFFVTLPNGSGWYIPMPSHDTWDESREYWYTFEEPKDSNLTPIWIEPLGKGIHGTIPETVMERALDRGERGVRRITRFWPYNHILINRVVKKDGNAELHFYWKKESGND